MAVRRRGQEPESVKYPERIQRPSDLTGYAREHWDAVFPELESMELVTHLDVPALMAMCNWWAEFRKMQELETADPGEAYKRSIAMASANKQWRELADRFGLTPKSREKLSYKKLYNDPVAKFLR